MIGNKDQVNELLAKFDNRVADHLEAITEEKQLLGVMRTTMRLYDDLDKWAHTGQSFEEWLEIARRYYYDDEFMKLDTDGYLRGVADEYFKLDLRPYFDAFAHVDTKDLEILTAKRKSFEYALKQLESK